MQIECLATRNSILYNPPPFLSLSFSPFPFQALKDLASFYLHATVESRSLVSFAVIWDVFGDAAVPVIPFWARAGKWNTAEQSMPCAAGTETNWSEEKSFTLRMFAELIIF